MEDICSLWSYQENIDELKQKLLYTTLELEAVRMEANELLNLLKFAYQERDEAKTQLQKLLIKLMPSSPTELLTIMPHHIQPETPLLVKPTNSSFTTESNSLTETYNNNNHHNSHVSSSPVDSFFDPVSSSPELSAISVPDSSNNGSFRQPCLISSNTQKIIDHDQASVLISSLAKGKALPKKGELLQAVMEAGPLLQTLLVAGPLPRWRNPPPPLQHFKIPPVSIRGCDSAAMNQKQPANPFNDGVQRQVNSSPYVEMSCGGSSQMISTPMLNFACLGDIPLSSSIGKRQRLH